MARGKKYNDDLMEKARALLSVNNSVDEVARKLQLPYSTVSTWRKKFEKDEDEEQNLVNLRQKKKEEFIEAAWRTIGNGQRLLERRTERALKEEDTLDAILEEARRCMVEEGGISKAVLIRLSMIRLDDIGKLSTMIGTLYDKQALAAREPTEILDGKVAFRKFEDFET